MKKVMLIVLAMLVVGCMGPPTREGGYNPEQPWSMLNKNCPEGTVLAEYRIPNDQSAWKDGTVSQFCMDMQGLAQGLVKSWDDGVLDSEGQYINDKQVGSWRFFAPNGETMLVNFNENGERDGVEFGYYPSGRLEYTKSFTCGLENGLVVWYQQNGSLSGYCSFTAGKRDGECVSYALDGSVRSETEYDFDRVVRAYNSMSAITFVNSNGDGYVERHDVLGQIRARGPYENGLQHGCWELSTGSGRSITLLYHHGEFVSSGCYSN